MFKPRSFHLQWHITEKCNLRCKHCYINPNFLKKELPLKVLIGILNQYLSQIKKWKLSRQDTKISFTGGEPFLRNDFFEILQECYKNRKVVQYGILTNGTLLDRKTVKNLQDLRVNYVQVSLEGMEKVNDYIRGKGVFKKVIKSIQLLKREKILVGISMTVNKENLQDVPAMIVLANNLNINYLSLRKLIPVGRGGQMKESILNIKEVKKLFLYILNARNSSKTNIVMGGEDAILAQEGHYLPQGCSAGYTSVTILPNGDVYPCRRLPLLSGNLLKQSFEDIYYNSKKLKEIRNLNKVNSTCQSCPYFNECCGGAKCISYAYFGNPFAPSPYCWRLFDKLPDSNMKWKTTEKKQKRLNQKMIKKF